MNPLVVVRVLEPLIFVVSVILLVWCSLQRANPLVVTFRPLWRAVTRRGYLLYVLIGLSVIAVDIALTAVDEGFTRAVLKSRGQDFTSLIWKIEGDGVAWFQRWMWTPLTWYFAWVYVIVFPALMPWAIVVFDYVGETRRNLSLLAAYLLNYLLVLPFYIWFPVRECHVFSSAGREHFTRLALDDLHPAIMTVLRPMSGVDNCFPSFHTSLAVTVALFAWQSRQRAFAWLAAVMCASVLVSTVYLGIHWLVDVGAGTLLGVGAYLAGDWLGKRWWAGRATRGRD